MSMKEEKMPQYDDDGGWGGGGFLPWGLFRFRPTTQETKEAGPRTLMSSLGKHEKHNRSKRK